MREVISYMDMGNLFTVTLKKHLRAQLQINREGLCSAFRKGSKKMKNK